MYFHIFCSLYISFKPAIGVCLASLKDNSSKTPIWTLKLDWKVEAKKQWSNKMLHGSQIRPTNPQSLEFSLGSCPMVFSTSVWTQQRRLPSLAQSHSCCHPLGFAARRLRSMLPFRSPLPSKSPLPNGLPVFPPRHAPHSSPDLLSPSLLGDPFLIFSLGNLLVFPPDTPYSPFQSPVFGGGLPISPPGFVPLKRNVCSLVYENEKRDGWVPYISVYDNVFESSNLRIK